MPLGSPLARGCTGIPPASLSVAAGPVVDESLRNGPMGASAPTTARAARSEAERVERGAGQMRSCNPMTSAPAPRESAIKPVPHPAAPVGEPSRTCRHHLTPPPVQRGGTKVPERDKKRSFLLDRARPVFFSARPKRKWGVYCPAISMAVFSIQTGGTIPGGPTPVELFRKEDVDHDQTGRTGVRRAAPDQDHP